MKRALVAALLVATTFCGGGGCATLSIAGGDITLVREGLAEGVVKRAGYRVSRIEHRPLSVQEARKLPRGVGSTFNSRSTHTAERADVEAARADGLARVSIIEASAEVWPAQGLSSIDRVSGTALWLQGAHMVETWCFSFVRDDVDPDCAVDLMRELASASGAAQAG